MTHFEPHNQNDRFILMRDVEALTAMRRSRIYEMIRLNSFPRQIRIVGRAVWSYSEIQQWMADRKAERDRVATAA